MSDACFDPNRPMVWRGRGGCLLGADGQPLQAEDGSSVKDWSDPRAVLLRGDGKPALIRAPGAAEGLRMITDPDAQPVYERNPAADRVPVLGPDDLINLAYGAGTTRSNRRERLRVARKAVAAMEAAGQIVREPVKDGERILQARTAA